MKWSKDEDRGAWGARSGPKDDNDEERSRLERGWITFDELAIRNDPRMLTQLATHEIGHLLGFRKGVFRECGLVQRGGGGDGRWVFKSKHAIDAARRSPLEDRCPILDLDRCNDGLATHWRERQPQSWHDIMEPRVWPNSAIGMQSVGVLRDMGFTIDDREIEGYCG